MEAGPGNSLAKTLSRPQALGGPGPACSYPGRPQAPAGPRGAAYGVPGARQAHARAMAELRAAAEPTRTLRGGGSAHGRAAATLRAAEHPRARVCADPEGRPRVVVRSTTPGPLPGSFATHPSPFRPPRALDSALT